MRVVPGDYDAGRYGRVVGDYDALYPGDPAETDASVDLMAELASSVAPATIVEFGIGTGRLALPLVARGFTVAGVDGSDEMVAALRAKAGGSSVKVCMGDYRDTVVRTGAFALVVLAANGIFDPRGISAQLDIFRNAKRHLVSGGYFVVETWVMHDHERSGDWSVWPRFVGDRHVELQLARYDIDTNTISRTLLHVRPTGTDFVTVADTYAAPGELDIMATVTGFERIARYSTWRRVAFTSASTRAISVFRLAGSS